MSGTLDQARRRSSTSAPSMSGSPRSRITRSGGLSVAQRSASAPVSASCTEKPSSSSPARRKRRICTSSSTTRTTGLVSVIGIDLGRARRCCKRQMDGHGGAAIGAGARSLDLAAVGADESLGDPEAKTRARRRRRMTRATEKSLADLRVLLRRQTRPLVMNRKHDIQYFQRTAVRRGRAFGWCRTDPVHDRWCGLHSANGDEVVLAQLKELSHVGEQSLLPGRSGRRNASLRACEDTTLLRIPKAEFQKVLTQRHT